jgi:hypothetical protein
MASRAAPYNMLMRTTLPCSANAVSYHGLGRKFPNAGAVVTAAMLQVDRLTRRAEIRLEDIPEAATSSRRSLVLGLGGGRVSAGRRD